MQGEDHHRVAELLVRLSGEPRNGKYRCPTPTHQDVNPSCSLFRRKDGRTGWKCWSCGATGDLANLLELAGVPHLEALHEIGVIDLNDDWEPDKSYGRGRKQGNGRRTSKNSGRGRATPARASQRASNGLRESPTRNGAAPVNGKKQQSFAEWSEGVLRRKPDCEGEGVAVPSKTVSSSEMDRTLYDSWAATWPRTVVTAHTEPAIRFWVKDDDGEQRRISLPVARVPLFDLQNHPSGWADRNLDRTEKLKWIYSKGVGVRAVGGNRLGDVRDRYWDPPRWIWVVEGHSDWLTGVSAAECSKGRGVVPIGVHGIGSMMQVVSDLAELVVDKMADTKLLVVADNDTAALGGGRFKVCHAAIDAWKTIVSDEKRNDAILVAPDPRVLGGVTNTPDLTDYWCACTDDEPTMPDAQSRLYDVITKVARTKEPYEGMVPVR